MDLKTFCYQLITENESLFSSFCDTSGIPSDKYRYSLYLRNLSRYKEKVACNEKLIDFFINLLENMKMFECPDFIEAINSNIEHILEYKTTGWKINLILTNEPMNKSNIYYSLLFLYKLRVLGHEVDNIHFETADFIIENNSIGDKALGVLCDDVSYSGTQLRDHIKPPGKRLVPFDGSKIKIFLNLVALLPRANKRIRKPFINDSQYVIGRGVTQINETDNYSQAKKVFSDVLEIDITSDFFEIFKRKMNLYHSYVFNKETLVFKKYDLLNLVSSKKILQLSFVILFQKYPDLLSTYPNLCKIDSIRKNDFVLDIDKLLEQTEMTEDEFLDIVSEKDSFTIFELLGDRTHFTGTTWVELIEESVTDTSLLLTNIEFIKKCKSGTSREIVINSYNTTGSITPKKIIKSFKGEYLPGDRAIRDIDYCTNFSIQPFYKKLTYKFDSKVLNIGYDVGHNMEDLARPYEMDAWESDDDLEETFYHKYLKYKNKYLSLCNKLK